MAIIEISKLGLAGETGSMGQTWFSVDGVEYRTGNGGEGIWLVLSGGKRQQVSTTFKIPPGSSEEEAHRRLVHHFEGRHFGDQHATDRETWAGV